MNPLLRAARGSRMPALFLDYDGTLVPLRPVPGQARLTSGRREILRRLAERFPVAIVSGRSLDDLTSLVGLPDLLLAGNHGLEILLGGARWVHPEAARARPALETLLGNVRPALSAIPGILIEDKGLTLSVHYRLSPLGSGVKIGRLLRRHLAGQKKGLVLIKGKKVYEIRPPGVWNKGSAALRILRIAVPAGSLPIYIGDDRTDEDAFRALAPIGLTARVGRRRRTAAQFRLAGIGTVWSVLRGLLEIPLSITEAEKTMLSEDPGGLKKSGARIRRKSERI